MVSGGNTRVNMSAGAAGQVGRAFASMGKDLQNAGMEVAGAFEEAERQHNIGKMADLKLELDQTYSSFQQEMASNPNDAINWREKWGKVLESKKTELSKRDMSRGLREQTITYFKGFEGKSGINVSHTAHTTILQNAKGSAAAVVADLQSRGLFNEAQAYTDRSRSEGTFSDAEATRQTLLNNRGRKEQENQNMILADPYAAASAFETKQFDTPTARDKAIFQALQRQDVVERLGTEEINDRIRGGEDVTDEEINELFHPSATEAISNAIEFRRDYNNLTTQAKIAMPEYQTQLKGKIHAMFAGGLDVTNSGEQPKRREVERLIRQVTDESDQLEFERMLARADKGEEVANTAISKVLAQANADGTMPIPKMETKDVKFKDGLQNGLLNKEKLLELYRMTPSQASKIDKLSSNREYTEAAKLLKKTVNNIDGDSKRRAFSPSEKGFYGGLVFGETLPSFEKKAYTESGTPEQVGKLEKAQRIYSKRAAIIDNAVKTSFQGQDLSKISPQELKDEMRKVLLMFDDARVQDILDEEDRLERRNGNVTYEATPQGYLPSFAERKANWENKEYFISADANWSEGVPVIPPLVIVPPNAPEELMRGANMYANEMLALHKEIDPENRKEFKAQVITAGTLMANKKPWRGKEYVTHLEGFAITDKKMVEFLKTKKGKARYRQILNKSFGNAYGATIGLPHTDVDEGAEDKSTGDTEVSLAKWLLSDIDEGTQATESTPSTPSVPQMRLGY